MQELVNLSQQPDNLKKAEEYLNGRSLRLFDGAGYVPMFQDGSLVIIDSLILPIYNPVGGMCLIDTRPLTGGKNSYHKIQLYNNFDIPVYNIKGPSDWRIITEGILNAECLNQIEGISIPASSTLTASFNARVMHYLAASVNTGLLLAVDNDSAGVGVASKAIEFYREFYPELTVQVLDYPFGDLNDFLMRKGRSVFNKHMLNQIRLSTV